MATLRDFVLAVVTVAVLLALVGSSYVRSRSDGDQGAGTACRPTAAALDPADDGC